MVAVQAGWWNSTFIDIILEGDVPAARALYARNLILPGTTSFLRCVRIVTVFFRFISVMFAGALDDALDPMARVQLVDRRLPSVYRHADVSKDRARI